MLLGEGLGHCAEGSMVVRSRIMADTLPVNGVRSVDGIRMILDDACITLLRVGPPLIHNVEPRESHLEVDAKLVFRQIALKTPAFLTVRIEDEDGWRPHCFKAAEVFRVLFDMDRERDEVVVDELREFGICVRLGFQPSAASSLRCGAEIDEQWFV